MSCRWSYRLCRRLALPLLVAVSAALSLCAQDQAAQAQKAAQAEKTPATEKKAGAGDMFGGPKIDQAAVDRGQKLFAPTCGFCHGADAAGKSAPDLIRSPLVLHDEGGSVIGPVIHNGRPDRGMPAFPSLTSQQIADIAAFLKFRKQSTANRFSYIIQGLLTGNADAGKQYFNDQGKCATCHSPSGDLAGIATRYQPADLQRQFLSPGPSMMDAYMGKPVKPLPSPKVTIHLPSGETLSGTLVRANEFNIEYLDSAGWHRSVSRQGATVDIQDPMSFHRDQLPKYTDADMHNLLAYLETLK